MTQNRKPEREQDHCALVHRVHAVGVGHLELKTDIDILYMDIDT
jgi:hypothetical protein